MNEPTVVLVTGALSGIGRATALAFAHAKARIAISGRRADEGQALAETLRSLGAEAEFVARMYAWKTTCRRSSSARSRASENSISP
jgi:NAD(P)-dependent dehydrogenase (short-subunit alcohol dehydrogenase family)